MASKKPDFNDPAKETGPRKGQGINAPVDERGRTALHVSVGQGDIVSVVNLLKLPVNLNQRDGLGQTALYAAVAIKNIDMVKVLLDRGARFRVSDDAGRTPLMWAIEQHGDIAFLEQLRRLGCPLAAKSKADGRTALHAAAAANLSEVVDYLLQNAVPIDAADGAGKTALHVAVEAKAHDMLRRILGAGANPLIRTAEIETPLCIAARGGDEASVDILLTESAVRRTVNDFRTHKEGFTPLLAAVFENNLAVAEKLLAIGADPNLRDIQGRHSLFIAVDMGYPEMAKLLIRHGADVAKAPTGNVTAESMLHRASPARYKEMLKILCDAGADVDTTNVNGRTALYTAIAGNDAAKIATLLELGADPNKPDMNGSRPIDCALVSRGFYNNFEVIKALLEAGAEPAPGPQNSPLHLAAAGGYTDIARLLLKYKAPVDGREHGSQGATAFMRAAQSGHVELCRFLLQAGADPLLKDKQQRTALHLVSSFAPADFLKSLCDIPGLKQMIDAQDSQGRTALHHACAAGSFKYIEILFDRGANPRLYDEFGLAPLHYAAGTHDVSILAAFNRAGGGKDIWNIPDKKEGNTPLHSVAYLHASQAMAAYLLKMGADLTLKNKKGLTVLHVAALMNQHANVELLVRHMTLHKMHPDGVRDDAGWTALHHAATCFHAAVAEILTKAGADVNARTADGDTPLHIAAQKGKTGPVAYLLSQKAELGLTNKAGATPLDLALAGGHTGVVKTLTAALEEKHMPPPLAKPPEQPRP